MEFLLADESQLLKRVRALEWPFQQTFVTPAFRLPDFADLILSGPKKPVRRGRILIVNVVFEPDNLNRILGSAGLSEALERGSSLEADDPQILSRLLEATWNDMIDFVFLPDPKSFFLYADHDEYTTIFANSKANLNHVVKPLEQAGIKTAEDYTRPKRLFL